MGWGGLKNLNFGRGGGGGGGGGGGYPKKKRKKGAGVRRGNLAGVGGLQFLFGACWGVGVPPGSLFELKFRSQSLFLGGFP